MNAITASAPASHRRTLPSIAQAARQTANLIAPRDHAGKGNWDKDADIPLWAWPASLALAAFFLFGPEILGRLLRFVP
ncbi:hypothetical protein [Achromobacter kerstersii]|uniref:hypothetical protein n=1 Tax=Achromobacter kerstersii TaxID=1353890 RepID=UPI003CFFA530